MSDILAQQGADERSLAEVYDLEHDAIVEDLGFYTEMARRHGPRILDLGCGSGRLFSAFMDGGSELVVGVDGSAALVERAEERVASDPELRRAHGAGRIDLVLADVRHVALGRTFDLAVLAGVIPHLGGVDDARNVLRAARAHLEPGGALIVDLVGPGGLPALDLPFSVDWAMDVEGARLVRRSGMRVARDQDGHHVEYTTETERTEPDGTISRLPARFRLWYPSVSGLSTIAEEADLDVDVTFGSYELDRLDEDSDRCILVLRRPTVTPGKG